MFYFLIVLIIAAGVGTLYLVNDYQIKRRRFSGEFRDLLCRIEGASSSWELESLQSDIAYFRFRSGTRSHSRWMRELHTAMHARLGEINESPQSSNEPLEDEEIILRGGFYSPRGDVFTRLTS